MSADNARPERMPLWMLDNKQRAKLPPYVLKWCDEMDAYRDGLDSDISRLESELAQARNEEADNIISYLLILIEAENFDATTEHRLRKLFLAVRARILAGKDQP